jgi:hypothetical protein
MPQQPLSANVARNLSNVSVPLTTDNSGNLLMGQGSASKLNITAVTVVKATAGRVCKVIVNAANSTAVKVYDTNTTGSVATANQIYAGPTTGVAGTVVALDFPCLTGIVVDPGTGGNVTVAFD